MLIYTIKYLYFADDLSREEQSRQSEEAELEGKINRKFLGRIHVK